MVQKVLQPFGARIRWFIEGPINGTHRCLRTVSRRADSFNRSPKNKQRGGVKEHTRRAANPTLLEAYFALAVIQASL